MIDNTKCECGHQNYVGTVLCESCGKPLFDEEGTTPLEMRYDGVARRSQRANPNIIDRVWNFFSSVKVAVYLILITLCGAALGTIYPQETTFLNIDPSVYYQDKYGNLGQIYYVLGLTDTYGSWWFIGLLVMIGTSLVVCSLDRVLPLYRALSKQKIRKHINFMTRQKVVFQTELGNSDGISHEQRLQSIGELLRKKRYRVYSEDQALLAEKNRFSRWGPYINHIGLIIFLLAVLARQIPGWHMDQYIGFLEGQPVPIPGTPYYLENERFTVDYYTKDEMNESFRDKDSVIAKLYETKAVLYECTANCGELSKQPQLTELTKHNIIVNDPLNYKGLLAYQFDFAETPQLVTVKPQLKDKATGQVHGQLELHMRNPKSSYTAGAYKLELIGYYPEFGLNDQGLPTTLSNEPKAPAFIFLIKGPNLPQAGTRYIYFPRPVDKEKFGQDQINASIGTTLEMSIQSMETDLEIANYTSYLNIRVDKAMPYIWLGAAIFMIGVVMGLYWQHRRVWIRIDGDQLTLGAHTNKNWYGLRHEIAAVLNKSGFEIQPKVLENEVAKL